jgi:hypothetical protein
MKIPHFLKDKSTYFYLFTLILAGQRFLHLGSFIDEPHSWRQFDTYYYAYDFYKNGIHLLTPSVCWMGSYKTLILEFPIISAIMSCLFDLFRPSVILARLTVLIFYLGSALYLFKFVKHLCNRRMARFTIIVYLMLPVSLYYSRSIQVDFPAMCFSLAMIYYYIVGVSKSNFYYIIIGAAFGIFAFLIKSPFAFYLYLPLLFYAIKTKKTKLLLKSLPILVLPIALFIIWQVYSIKVNAETPDWYFLPGYFKFTNMSEWYFGYINQRLSIGNWEIILGRFVESGTSYIGIVPFIIGLFIKTNYRTGHTFFYYYAAGLIIYLLMFFNLVLIHEYYLIPLLVISSYFITVTLDYLYLKLKQKSNKLSYLVVSFSIFILAVNSIWFTERWYYKIDHIRLNASEYIEKNTNENDLIITSIDGTDPRDPRILAQSLRNGWAVDLKDLRSEIIDSLRHYNAKYLTIVSNEKIDTALTVSLSKYKSSETLIYRNSWYLRMYQLQ